jgi:hypothetical protein
MKWKFNRTLVVMALAVTWWPIAPCHAEPLLKIDFGTSGAPSPVQPGFIGVAGGPSDATHFQTVGDYTVLLENGQGFHHTAASAGNVGAGVRDLFRDYYYNNLSAFGDIVSLALGGFQANTTYDVTIWSYDADQIFSATTTEWQGTGDTTGTTGTIVNFATPYPTSLSERSTTLQLSSTTGTLEIFGTPTSGDGGTRLNAVRVSDGSTDLLSLDFGRTSSPASPIQPTYTGLAGDISHPNFSQTVGAFTVSLEGQGFFHTTSTNVDSIDLSVRDFYRDYYYNNAIGTGETDDVELTIEGVTPNTDYVLRLWSYDADNFSETPTSWTPTGDTTGQTGQVTNLQDPFPTSFDDNDTTIRVRSSTSTLSVRGITSGGTGGTRLNGFELSLAPEGVDGDYNDDDTVDAADYVVWRKFVGTDFPLDNDPDGGTIDDTQYNTWQMNFAATNVGGAPASNVPEPSSSIFVTLGLILALSCKPIGAGARNVNLRATR